MRNDDWLIKITEDSSVSANKTFLYLFPSWPVDGDVVVFVDVDLFLALAFRSSHFMYICVTHASGRAAPSPRQRCRIRTNPWLSIADGSGSNAATMPATPKIMDCETGSTSSGVKSNSDAGVDEKNWLPNGYLFT